MLESELDFVRAKFGTKKDVVEPVLALDLYFA